MFSSVQGTIHQGDECFSPLSRGRQCLFMVLSALLHSQSWHVQQWTQRTLDELLHFADGMYLHALQKSDIPDTATLLVSHLPSVATSLDGRRWTITYGQRLEGFVNDSSTDTMIPNFKTLSSALINTFQVTNSAIMVHDGYMVALTKDRHCFALFDSHARTARGMPCADGSSTICTFSTLPALQEHIQSLSARLNSTHFEIVPLSCIDTGDKSLSPQGKKQQANRKQYLKRKLSESETQKQTRLSKAVKYKKDNINQISCHHKQRYKRTKTCQNNEE